MSKRILLLLILSAFVLSVAVGAAETKTVFNIKSFGAVGDGETLDTAAVQAAIDACTDIGGGRVLVPNGTFVIGTVYLKSNVELYLSPSAVLKGSSDLSHYAERSMILVDKAENVAVSGRGTLDGNGGNPNFRSEDSFNGIKGRPHLIRFRDCRRVKLQDFTAKDGGSWNISLYRCDFTTIDDVQILARAVANNDGIDIVDCHDTIVSNCYFDCGDDSICPKSESSRKVKRLTITNCIVKSESNGIKFGTASVGGFEDVTISNCVLFDTRLAGIALEVVDGGVMDRVTINNITMTDVNGAIFIKIGVRKGEDPALRNVMISNVIADGIGCWLPDRESSYFKEAHDSRIGIGISGQPGHWLENVVLRDMTLRFAGGGTEEDAAAPDFKDNRAKSYPEYINFGITPAYGINCRYAENVRFENITLSCQTEDFRPAVMFQDVRSLRLDGLQAKVSDKAPALVRFKNAEDVFVARCKPERSPVPFCTLEENCRDITLLGNDFSRLDRIFNEDVPSGEVKMQGNLEPVAK